MREILAFGAATARGTWPVQEDAYWIDSIHNIFILADAMGGEGVGDKVAALAVKSAGEFLVDKLATSLEHSQEMPFFSPEEDLVHKTFLQVNQHVLTWNKEMKLEEKGGVSLCIAVFFSSGRAVIGNIGSTGAALVRNKEYLLLLRPQTMYSSRGFSSEGVNKKIGADFPLQFLGEYQVIRPEVRTYHFQSKDRIALFSEGARYCAQEIRENEPKPLEELAKSLVATLVNSESQEKLIKNSTLVLIDFSC